MGFQQDFARRGRANSGLFPTEILRHDIAIWAAFDRPSLIDRVIQRGAICDGGKGAHAPLVMDFDDLIDLIKIAVEVPERAANHIFDFAICTGH